MRFLAQLISVVFHPIFVPFYATLLLVWCNPYMFGSLPDGNSVTILGTVLLYSVLYPLVVIVLMRQLNFIDSYELTDYRERILVAIPTLFFLFWTYNVQSRSNYNQAVADIPLAATICLVVAVVYTALRDRISWHTMGMGAWFATMLVLPKFSVHDLSLPLLLMLLLAGAVGSSRLYLQAHTLRQVYMGYVVGFVVQSLVFIF